MRYAWICVVVFTVLLSVGCDNSHPTIIYTDKFTKKTVKIHAPLDHNGHFHGKKRKLFSKYTYLISGELTHHTNDIYLVSYELVAQIKTGDQRIERDRYTNSIYVPKNDDVIFSDGKESMLLVWPSNIKE